MNEPMLEELDWLAFQYVMNELTEADRVAFELRLEDDQEAREAVARAVELSAAIRMQPSAIQRPTVAATASTMPRVSIHKMMLWVGTLAAAVLVALSLWLRPTLPSAQGVGATDIALAWNQLRQAEEETAPTTEPVDDIESDWLLEDEDIDDEPVAAPPSWLVAGVALANR